MNAVLCVYLRLLMFIISFLQLYYQSTFYFWCLQSLAVVTLGDKQMAQRIDNLEGADELKRFYLQVS